MSPEQANGDAIDHRTDLFSFGSVLYFIATGHPPFRAERAMGVLHRICNTPHRPVWQVNAKVPQELSQVIDRLLEKNPSKRVGSALAVRETLARILANVQSGRPAIGVRLNTWLHRHQWTAMAAVLLSIFTVLSLSAIVVLTQSTRVKKDASSPIAKQSDDLLETEQITKQDAVSVRTALDESERIEFDRSVRQLNTELDRLEAVPRVSNESDRWNDELQFIDRFLIELDRSN